MIVVSLIAHDSAALSGLALAQVGAADAIELRLDALADAPRFVDEDLAALVRALGQPVIVAVNAADAHGRFTGDDRARLDLLSRAARAGVAFVDVDSKLASALPALPRTCRRIVSHHDVKGTPTDLARAFAELEASAQPADLLKFVTHARTAEDGVRLLEFARGLTREAIVFASGEAGRFTRILAPIFGSVATYAAPSLARPTAPSASSPPASSAPSAAPHASDLGQAPDAAAAVIGDRALVAARVSAGPGAATRVVDGGPTAPGQLRIDELRAAWPRAGVTRQTHVFAVLGRPVGHSLSPRLHGAVFRDSGRDAVYVAIEPRALETFLPLCRAPNWRGFSVTAPFKQTACRLATVVDDTARDVHAANTLVPLEPGGWKASNTDTTAVEDLLRARLELAKISPRAARALVIGTGGAARAALSALDRLSFESIVVTGRSFDRTVALALERAVEAAELGDVVERRFDVVVQCTPAGSREQPDVMPIDACVLRKGKVFVEAVYRPARTPLVMAAERVGAHVVLGTEWFLAQARGQAATFAQGPWSEAALERELLAALSEDADRDEDGAGDSDRRRGGAEASGAETPGDETLGFETLDAETADAGDAGADRSTADRSETSAGSTAALTGARTRARVDVSGHPLARLLGAPSAGDEIAAQVDVSGAGREEGSSLVEGADEREDPAYDSTVTIASGTRRVEGLADVGDRLRRAFPRVSRPRVRPYLERTIAFVGLRACGKSSVGAALARELGASFVDLDEQVVRLVDDPTLPSAGDVLRSLGVSEFRRLESLALHALLTCGEPLVLATGGGVVESDENRSLLSANALVVWLRAPIPELQRRLAADPTLRPALIGPDPVSELPELARRRESLYAAVSRRTLDAASATPEALAKSLLQALLADPDGTIS